MIAFLPFTITGPHQNLTTSDLPDHKKNPEFERVSSFHAQSWSLFQKCPTFKLLQKLLSSTHLTLPFWQCAFSDPSFLFLYLCGCYAYGISRLISCYTNKCIEHILPAPYLQCMVKKLESEESWMSCCTLKHSLLLTNKKENNKYEVWKVQNNDE